MLNKLFKNEQISPWQWAIMLSMFGIGSEAITAGRELIPLAQQSAWLAVLAAGGFYFCSAWLMIRLAAFFPGQTLTGFLRIIWGNLLGSAMVWIAVLTITAAIVLWVQNFSREITFFMFDRTPQEVIILTILAVAAYCAVQDLATVLRVSQILFFTVLPLMMGIILLGYISFQVINIYPLWPVNIAGIGRAVLESWMLFGGYEFILYLFPFIYKRNTSIVQATFVAFAAKALMIAMTVLMVIGVHSVEGAQGIPYPTMVAIRGVELPGTFVERLDNYLFFIWIPAAFITLAQHLYLSAAILAELHGYRDHRPFVLLLLPMLFIGSMVLHDLTVFDIYARLVHWLGLAFSFGLIPASYLLARWQRHKQGVKLNAS